MSGEVFVAPKGKQGIYVNLCCEIPFKRLHMGAGVV
jgi:hypothetical protein